MWHWWQMNNAHVRWKTCRTCSHSPRATMNHFFFSPPSFKFHMSENCFFARVLGSCLCLTAVSLPTRRVTVCSRLQVGASGRSGAPARGEMFHSDIRLDRRLWIAAHWCGCHQHAAAFFKGNFNRRREERWRVKSMTGRQLAAPGNVFFFFVERILSPRRCCVCGNF